MTEKDQEIVSVLLVSIILLVFMTWILQELGMERVSSTRILAAQEVCVGNGGLDYIRHELFESPDYVCKNGAEGVILEYLSYKKGETK